MNITGRVNGALTQIALWAALGIISLCLVLTAIGFLVSGFDIWMTHYMSKGWAAAATGGMLLAVTILLLVIGGMVIKKSKKRYPSMAQELKNTIGLGTRLLTLVVARDPRKAMIVSLVAGALAEFITSERRK